MCYLLFHIKQLKFKSLKGIIVTIIVRAYAAAKLLYLEFACRVIKAVCAGDNLYRIAL